MTPSEHQELLESREVIKLLNFLLNTALLGVAVYAVMNDIVLKFLRLTDSWFPNAHCTVLNAMLFAFAGMCIFRSDD